MVILWNSLFWRFVEAASSEQFKDTSKYIFESSGFSGLRGTGAHEDLSHEWCNRFERLGGLLLLFSCVVNFWMQ